MGANKYRKGLRDSTANSVNQSGRGVPNDLKLRQVGREGRGVGRGRAGHGTAVHGRAGLVRVG